MHPDFLWVPEMGTKATSANDDLVISKKSWSKAAIGGLVDSMGRVRPGASRYGQPVGPIVDRLIELSSR